MNRREAMLGRRSKSAIEAQLYCPMCCGDLVAVARDLSGGSGTRHVEIICRACQWRGATLLVEGSFVLPTGFHRLNDAAPEDLTARPRLEPLPDSAEWVYYPEGESRAAIYRSLPCALEGYYCDLHGTVPSALPEALKGALDVLEKVLCLKQV